MRGFGCALFYFKETAMFTLSVIIPVYNSEKYIEETIESVINQSLAFRKNIQLIIVNDGSTDGSESICLKYKELYPNNIDYIYKENGGVSSARNEGMKYIKGKYVNFLDSDDKWEKGALKKACSFFDKHYDEIDVLSCRVKFFEAKEGFHSLDYKFDAGSRVADLNSEDELFTIQSTAATAVIKANAIGKLCFDTALKYGEDSTFVNKLIMKTCRMGIVKEAVYLYRRRADESSAVNNQTRDKEYYLETLNRFHQELINHSVSLYGKAIPYIQSVVSYDLMWRFGNAQISEVLSAGEYESFCRNAHDILSYVDRNVIINNPVHKSVLRKSEAMRLKDGEDFLKSLRLKDGSLCYGESEIFVLKRNKSRCCCVVGSEIKNGRMKLEMLVAEWIFGATKNGGQIILKAGKKEVFPDEKPYNIGKAFFDNEIKNYYRLCTFEFEIKQGKQLKIRPFIIYGEDRTSISMSYGKFIPNANAFAPAYQKQGRYIVRYLRTVINVFTPESPVKERRRLEKKCILFLIKKRKFREAFTRAYVPFFRRKNKEEIWLLSDRIDNAGDNGEVLFKYICEHKPEGVRPIFVIGKEAPEDVKARLNVIGEVTYFESGEYPYLFLCAKKIISSSGADFTTNPFGKNKKYFHSLFGFDYYYLQHGVTCADLSVWLNRFNKNIYRFFVSGEKERAAILEADYGYSPEKIVLTGQPRFDALYNEPKKQILVLPTWRRSIKKSYDEKTSSVYFEGFKETEYFKFYNSLINNERLLKTMREKGYTGLFCLHPIHMKQYVDYNNNDVFSVNKGYVDYNKVFAESSVMVTDYSSVLFDFAYLRKPVVYTQFDKESFFEGQIYDEGYFKYETDGFGKVCYSLDDAVSELIRLIETDCKNSNEYIDRVNSFFAFNDAENSKRILKAILETDG